MASGENFIDGRFNFTVLYRGPLTESIAIDRTTGLFARGFAKQNPLDVYNKDVGKTLSQLRSMQRLLRKVERKVVRDTF